VISKRLKNSQSSLAPNLSLWIKGDREGFDSLDTTFNHPPLRKAGKNEMMGGIIFILF